MQPIKILTYCLENLEDTILVESWGEKGIFYNPNHVLKRGVYVLTIKEKDGQNDKASHLNRKDVFRVNLGLHKDTFKKLFGEIPKRPVAGGVIDKNHTCLPRRNLANGSNCKRREYLFGLNQFTKFIFV